MLLVICLSLCSCGAHDSIDRQETQMTEEETQMTEEETQVPERVVMDPVDLASYIGERTVTVNSDDDIGSGFFISSNGLILTCYHVIEGATSITVDVSGGSYDVESIEAFSKVYDLAVLKIDKEDTPYLEQCTEVRTGEAVYAVGSSLGELEGSFTAGTVSSSKRTYGMMKCIQMDTAISDGNSGGPLVNAYGEVVGVNTMTYSTGQNTNLAVKIEMLECLSFDRSYTLPAYREWYNKETSRSYSPYNIEFRYYYSTINTYTTVTGRSCLYSFTEDSKKVNGYKDMCLYYGYDYTASELDQYTEYLSTIGFEYQPDISEENQYVYYSICSNTYIVCEVDQQQEIVEIAPMKPDILDSILS